VDRSRANKNRYFNSGEQSQNIENAENDHFQYDHFQNDHFQNTRSNSPGVWKARNSNGSFRKNVGNRFIHNHGYNRGTQKPMNQPVKKQRLDRGRS